jgi:hypothetical protein
VFGIQKQGVGFGYTRVRGYHPLLATRADTGEVLHIRCRTGSANTSRGMGRFLDELIAWATRAGSTGPKLLRADSGYWSKQTFNRLDQAGWAFSIGVRLQPAVRRAIEQIDEDSWTTLDDYPPTSIAMIVETTYNGRRLIVRRVRTLDRQGQLLPTWELYTFLTDRTDELRVVDAEHRKHAVVEHAIRDLKDQALAHFPSGHYSANAAWTVIGALAHNLSLWTQTLALPDSTVRTARTLRRRLFIIPARLIRTARRWTLRMPARWPWAEDFLSALRRNPSSNDAPISPRLAHTSTQTVHSGLAAEGLAGGDLAAFAAFAPSFLFVMLIGPRFEALRTNQTARTFLDGPGPAAIGAVLGAAVLLRSGLHSRQWVLLRLVGLNMFVLRSGVAVTLLGPDALGVVAVLAGLGAHDRAIPNPAWPWPSTRS